MPVLPVLSAAVGGALGLFLDRGLSVLLPCLPFPEPFLTGWGWAIGAVAGLAAGFGLRTAATAGSLAAPPKGAVARAFIGGFLFVLASTVMVGGIGYAAGRRATVDQATGQLRELRRDIDKKLIEVEEATPRLRQLEAKVATAHEPRQAYSTTRRAATVAALVSALFGASFAAMAVVYRRAIATRDRDS